MEHSRTLIMMVIDESGSMGIKQPDVIGGFNRFLEDQKALPDPCRMGVVMFNTNVRRAVTPRNINDVPPLDATTYRPGGNTALLDAVGLSIRIAEEQREESERILMVIMTDGEENSSQECSLSHIKTAIKQKEAEGKWTFTYMGVNPDQWTNQIGLPRGNTIGFEDVSEGFLRLCLGTNELRNSDMDSLSDFYDDNRGKLPEEGTSQSKP